MIEKIDFKKYEDKIAETTLYTYEGTVRQVIGLCIEANGPSVSVGDLCYINTNSSDYLKAEVVGFADNRVFLMPLGEMRGIKPGARIVSYRKPLTIGVSNKLLGRVLNGLGETIDNGEPLFFHTEYPVNSSPPSPLSRTRIDKPLETGVGAIDALLTIGRGQRMGIFSGSGVGKSSLLGMIARYTEAEVAVIGLIGERGREVNEFLEKDLGKDGLQKSVVVVATSDQPPLVRLKASLIATTIAEYFRDQGKDVVLMMDSITRIAMAQRDVGLAINEPPTTKGYTPSVFSFLPQLLERSGTAEKGSISGFYTILVEADDMNDPIADTARSILDGHIVLSRQLSHMNHYPAVDVLASISRVMPNIISHDHREAVRCIREILANYKEAEDLINIGAYVKGTNTHIDTAIENIESIKTFLKQKIEEPRRFQDTLKRLIEISRYEAASGNTV
ncbi:MAG: flagellar protein export ATPase FliI [Candidatus Omnitrophica bacterium]|nr:flagellar protein export ATPase FliI [Candidatus Omnitrophota bacterium]